MLLYSDPNSWILDDHLLEWVEYLNPTVFRKKVLGKLHTERMIEYDQENGAVRISPIGERYIEPKLIAAPNGAP